MKTIATFNALHLGDNLIHLHFLRKLAAKYPEIQFTHGAPDEHLAQLAPVWADVPNIEVSSISHIGQGAINAWCGAGGWWYHQPSTHDWCATILRWFHRLAREMGLESPFTCSRDLLFDYPALQLPRAVAAAPFEFLIVNSRPMSGQWSGYSEEGFAQLGRLLGSRGHVATTAPLPHPAISWCTQQHRMDVTAIGRLSQSVKCIIGCVTGPMWVTNSVWNDPKTLRIHLQDREFVNIAPNTVHTNSLSLVPEILKDRGLL